MSQKQKSLVDLRVQIDSIDKEIHELINRRAQCALDVAEVKRQQSKDTGSESAEAIAFFRPEREADVLRRVIERNKGPLEDEEIARLFRQIMSSCLALEQPLRVAYLGPEGTFTQQATIKHFGHSVKTVSMGTIDEVFREVEARAVNFGLVPVENSTEGVVNTTLDAFKSSDVRICGEVELRIHQNFLIGENTRPDSISKIYSHPQSLAQCRKWIDSNYPQVDRVAVSSNADAARLIKNEWNAAAIAGDMAADVYGLQKLAINIEDNPNNTTRFLVIGHQVVGQGHKDKSSIIVSTQHEPGALHSLLVPFYEKGINLTRIETRPSHLGGSWSYVFFIDFEGHESDETIQKLLNDLREKAVEFRCLGSYPQAIL